MRVIKHYTVPSGASHAGTQQLRFLAELDKKHYRKAGGKAGKSDLTDARCLEYYANRAGLGRSAYEASGTMWNSEYVIALILTSNNLSDAVPEGWLEPPRQAQQAASPDTCTCCPCCPRNTRGAFAKSRLKVSKVAAWVRPSIQACTLLRLCHACSSSSSRESTREYRTIALEPSDTGR